MTRLSSLKYKTLRDVIERLNLDGLSGDHRAAMLDKRIVAALLIKDAHTALARKAEQHAERDIERLQELDNA